MSIKWLEKYPKWRHASYSG
jgi:hypothetical protein